MRTFLLYILITCAVTGYVWLSLYEKEKDFFAFTIYLVKSNLHLFLAINFCIMIIAIVGRILLFLFFGNLKLREISQAFGKVRYKIFLLFMVTADSHFVLDVNSILTFIIFFATAFFARITFIQGSYLATNRVKSAFLEIKLFVALFMLLIGTENLSRFLYYDIREISRSRNTEEGVNKIFYQCLSFEFFELFVRVYAKIFTLSVDITSIGYNKTWDHRLVTFKIIKLLKVGAIFSKNVFQAFVLYKLGTFPYFLLLNLIMESYKILNLIYKIYEAYKVKKYILNLADYSLDKEVTKYASTLGTALSTEEREKIKTEKTAICNICLCELEEGKYLNCGHIFHLKCITEWISSNTKCPICKAEITMEKAPSKFLYNQLGILYNENTKVNNEDVLEKIKLGEMGNFVPYIPKVSSQMEKYILYEKILLVKQSLNKVKSQPKCGAVTYSLPREAHYDRDVEDEMLRIQTEANNQKIIELYQNPSSVLNRLKKNI